MESKQARPKTAEKKQESGSAFEQKGKGKTLAAPAFGLTASGAAPKEAKPEGGIEADFKSILEEGGYSDASMVRAARHVMRHYGMYDESLLDLKVVASAGKRIVAKEVGTHGQDSLQTILISRQVFYEDFSYVVRTLGHEYQHALYRWNRTDKGNSDENEFIAYTWELFEVAVGTHPNPTVTPHDEGYITPQVPDHAVESYKLESVMYAIKFYKKMPQDLQAKHADRYNKVLALKDALKAKSK
jgi:hypothetical protein